MRFLLSLLLLSPWISFAQNTYKTEVKIQPNEKWWGGMVGNGHNMPFGNTLALQDLAVQNYNNQNAPLLISSNGRYVWSDMPFKFSIQDNTISLFSDVEKLNVIRSGNTLREALLKASSLHFPTSGKMPEPIFFSVPQYNTWIELMYNQNQEDILKYAHDVKKYNFPEGVFMIDDNWQKYYGNFDFKPEKFSDSKAMID